MITIPEDELLSTLEYGYKQFSAAIKADNKQEQIRLKGWCNALEGIVFIYRPDLKIQLLEIRSKIIVLDKKEAIEAADDWETPTYIRKKLKL